MTSGVSFLHFEKFGVGTNNGLGFIGIVLGRSHIRGGGGSGC